MILGSKFLAGVGFVISGSASNVPMVSKSRETLVTESKRKFGRQQNKKSKRNRKLKKRLGIGVRFDSNRLLGQEGGFFDEEISFDGQGYGDAESGSVDISSLEKSYAYDSLDKQKESRNKVFEHQKKMIIEKYKKPENVWWSPDRELNEFEVSNDAVTLLIGTKFTDSEKSYVKDKLKEHWCVSADSRDWGKDMIVDKNLRPNLYETIYPPGNIFSGRYHFYYWWVEYCSGRQSRYPNWSDGSWPEVSVQHLMEGGLLV